MKKNLALLAGLSILAFSYTYYTDQGQAPAASQDKVDSPSHINLSAPDFSFTDIDGKDHSLKDFRGRAVVLNFWATWCAPCVIEFPQLLELARSEKETIFIFLSQDTSEIEIDRFLKKRGKALKKKNIIIARDENMVIARDLYQTYKLPETYLIGADGAIRDKIIGAADWNAPDIKEKIQSLSR